MKKNSSIALRDRTYKQAYIQTIIQKGFSAYLKLKVRGKKAALDILQFGVSTTSSPIPRLLLSFSNWNAYGLRTSKKAKYVNFEDVLIIYVIFMRVINDQR